MKPLQITETKMSMLKFALKNVKSHLANLFMANFSYLEPLCPGSSPNLQRKKNQESATHSTSLCVVSI